MTRGGQLEREGELERLCSKISLTAGEQVGIKITEGDAADIHEKGEHCLVGKIWSEKLVNKEAFHTMLSRIWRLVGHVTSKEIFDNVWLFEFMDGEDKRQVLKGRLWSFDRRVIVLEDFDGTMPPTQMQFEYSPFWIQVHDMSLLCMTKGVGVKIGESLGVVEDVDVAGDGIGWGRCLRIWVTIDLFKPLERGRALDIKKKSVWVSFKYENLPTFCFRCGRLVHKKLTCPVRPSLKFHEDVGVKEWGTWLRAEQPRMKLFLHGGGEGDFRHSPTRHDTEGGFR